MLKIVPVLYMHLTWIEVVVVIHLHCSLEVVALGIGEGQSDFERSGKNSGKNPPFCTGELDTIRSSLFSKKAKMCVSIH